jgi:hypothetical protein
MDYKKIVKSPIADHQIWHTAMSNYAIGEVEESLIKIKNPIIITNLITLHKMISIAKNSSNFSDQLFILLLGVALSNDKEQQEGFTQALKLATKEIVKIDFINRVYNLNGMEIPIYIIDDNEFCSNFLYIVNQKDDSDIRRFCFI